MNEEERVKTVKACKWVDEVVFDVPYSPSIKLLDDLNADFCVHGDDMPTNADGTSTYDEVKKAGRIRIIKRTEGVSTTDLVGRMLLMTRDHHLPKRDKEDTFDPAGTPGLVAKPPARTFAEKTALAEAGSNFLPTTKRLLQFANIAGSGINEAKKVIYIDGAFDLFHIGHIETLEKARSLGDFLLVGVHSDFTVNLHKGKNYPIMNLHERVLNVLACKYADEVIMGAPWVVTKDMITTMNIKLVVCGSNTKLGPGSEYSGEDPYGVPKALGIFQEIEISRDLTTETIVDRILANRARFEKRNQVREKKEKDYLQTKNFVPEI